MTLSPGLAGFIKGALVFLVGAFIAYLSDPSHLTFLSGSAALIVAGLASAIESALKAQSGGTTALFGAVSIKQG